MAQAISVRRSEPRPGGSGHSVEKKPSRWRWNVFALIVGLLFLAPFFWLVLTAFERYGGLNLTGGGGYTFSNFTGLFGNTAAAKDIGPHAFAHLGAVDVALGGARLPVLDRREREARLPAAVAVRRRGEHAQRIVERGCIQRTVDLRRDDAVGL